METITALVYKDFDMTQLWSPNEFIIDIDIITNRARVHDNSGFSSFKKVSRFNKLNETACRIEGGVKTRASYGLTVNGNRVYFHYNIKTK